MSLPEDGQSWQPADIRLKQVIVMRRDLKMRRGKEISQGGHAAMMFLATGSIPNEMQQAWLSGQMAKICVQVDSEAELDDVIEKARSAGLDVHVVTDLGRTEFHGVPTKTCCAIGPDLISRIDPVTRDLKLY